MTDWADEIAKELEREIWHQEGDHRYPCEYGLDLGVVAAALRKAKADGIREASALLDWNNPELWGEYTGDLRTSVYLWLLSERADDIEKGEHPPGIPDPRKGDNA